MVGDLSRKRAVRRLCASPTGSWIERVKEDIAAGGPDFLQRASLVGNWEIREGIIYEGGRVWVRSLELRRALVNEFHDCPVGGHRSAVAQ